MSSSEMWRWHQSCVLLMSHQLWRSELDDVYVTLRGGPNFGPVKYVKEVSHLEHMHADSLLIHLNFFWKLTITWLNFFENSLLIRFELMEVDQKWVFDQFINHVIMNCSKTHFWSTFISSNRIKSEFSKKLSHVIINFEEKLGWIKSESACIYFTWLTSFI